MGRRRYVLAVVAVLAGVGSAHAGGVEDDADDGDDGKAIVTGIDDDDGEAREPEVVAMLPADPQGAAAQGEVRDGLELEVDDKTWFELHGYARMPLNLQGTPRSPYLVDNDPFLSGFSYTRLYEPDWSELFFSAHSGNYRAKFGLFASLYSDYATATLENQLGIAQASIAADEFLGYEQLSVELGVFWDRWGYLEPYDTYLVGRTHQGGTKARWDFSNGAHIQAGVGVHQRPPQNQGMTALAYLTGGMPVGDVDLGLYVVNTWTRDKPQLSNIEDGDLLVVGADARYDLPSELGPAYLVGSYVRASQSLFLAPVIELMHSMGGRGLTENYFGTSMSNDGTGSLLNLGLDAPMRPTDAIDVRVFGMTTWARSDQVDTMNPITNKDKRWYLKWGIEPGYRIKPTVIASLRYDRAVLDMYDSENSFRAISPKLTFPLADWGELFVMYSHYIYGDKIQLRPGQVPLESRPDANVFKIQAQAVW